MTQNEIGNVSFSVFAVATAPVGDPSSTHGASRLVAFGENGEVVLTVDHHIYLYQHGGMKYSLAKKTYLPDGVGWDCFKAISNTTIFLQAHEYAPTHQLSSRDLHHMGSLDHKGKLLGLLYPSTLVYGQERSHKDWIIILHHADGEMILQPPRGRSWDWGLSVCRAGQYIVVVETWTQSIDAFSTGGNFLLLFSLSYIMLTIRFNCCCNIPQVSHGYGLHCYSSITSVTQSSQSEI